MKPVDPGTEDVKVQSAAGMNSVMSGIIGRVAKSLTVERVRLRDFYRECWPIVNSGKPYFQNWSTDLIAEHLEAVHIGQIHRLAINIPPRHGKSYHVTVAFPTWEWTEDPRMRFVFSSYSQNLCTRHSLDRRYIIDSAWYQNRWGLFVSLSDDQNRKTEFKNTAMGHMITAPVGGSATGSGGDRIIMDDMMDPSRANSPPQRERAHDFYDSVLTTRLDDEKNGAMILVEQRLHKYDMTGHIVNERDGWVKLSVPIESKVSKHYSYPISGKKHFYKAGDVLEPRRFAIGTIRRIRRRHPDGGAAQLDQEPQGKEGNLFKRNHWNKLSVVPHQIRSLWVWDTAISEKTSADWTAGFRIITWDRGYYFTHGLRERMNFPNLKIAVKNQYVMHPTDAILIEDKSSGQQLLQELFEGTDLPILGTDSNFNKLDKITRANLVLPTWTAGRIFVPGDDPETGKPVEWVSSLIEEAADFGPSAKFDDQVDAAVHGIRWFMTTTMAPPPSDEIDPDADSSSEAGMEDGL